MVSAFGKATSTNLNQYIIARWHHQISGVTEEQVVGLFA